MIYKLNKSERQRDHIIFGSHSFEAYMGGVRHFENLSLSKLERLIECNFIDLDDRQNLAPPVREIYDFMKKYPDYTAHGYTVSIMRDDYRVSLEGVSKSNGAKSAEELEDFMRLFKDADEVDTSSMYCWFD